MKLSNNISISSTNPQASGTPVVRIYKCNTMVAEAFINKRNPLAYLQSIKRSSKFLDELSHQLKLNSDYEVSQRNPESAGACWTLTLKDIEIIRNEAGINVDFY